MRSKDLRTILPIAVICICAVLSGLHSFDICPGIDFYQFWGVGMAQRLGNGELSSPYVQLVQYGALLDDYSRSSKDERLQYANALNHEINAHGLDANCTPLLFAVFSLLPDDYTFAFGIFSILRTLLLLGAALVLARALHLTWYLSISVVPLALVFYKPLTADACIGNVNAVQLFLVVILAWFLDRRRRGDLPHGNVAPSAVVLCGVAFFTLAKPNFLPVSLLMASSLYVLAGRRVFLRSAIIAGAFSAVLWAIPCLYFGSWAVWGDWLRYLSIAKGRLSYPMWQGNHSPVQLFAEVFGLDVRFSIVALGILMALSLLRVLVRAGGLGRGALRVLGDPYAAVAVAITATFALSPLVWYHYLLLSLLPVLWLLSVSAKCRMCGLLSLGSLVLSSGLIPGLLGDVYYLAFFAACAWLPIWIGILMAIRPADEKAVMTAPAQA